MNTKLTSKDLFSNKETATRLELFTEMLNTPPPKKWVKQHEQYDYNYLPIDRIEFLLRKMFMHFDYEILETKSIIAHQKPRLHVRIRVHYYHPIFDKMMFTDGEASFADNGEHGLVGVVKSMAIRNACLKFGKIFGADLNREVDIPTPNSQNTPPTQSAEMLRFLKLIESNKNNKTQLESLRSVAINLNATALLDAALAKCSS